MRINKFNSIAAFRASLVGDIYPLVSEVVTPAGNAIGYSKTDDTCNFYIHTTLVSSDSLQTMDFREFDDIDAKEVQNVIDNWEEGALIKFNTNSATLLKGELVVGTTSHWDGDTLLYGPGGGGYYYEPYDEIDDTDDGEAVDLGLPSGTLWMKSNLGGSKPSDFGLFYQWADTQGYDGVDEKTFNWDNYKWGMFDNLTKYNSSDGKLVLDNDDDPVYVASSGQYKSPTQDQLQELIDNTDHQWVRLANGVNGMKFINKNDDTKYIFIPAAGYCYDSGYSGVGSWGCVWSSSRDSGYPSYAWGMGFYSGDVNMGYDNRCYGYSVRGVVA